MGRTRLVAVLLGLLAGLVYLSNLRPMGSGDTLATRLLPFSLLREGDLDLDEFTWLRPGEEKRPYFLLRDAGGHWRSKYPVATPLIVTPLAWPFDAWARARGIADGDARFRLLTAVFERSAAAALAAMSVALVFLAACVVVPWPWAVAAALVYAFGTSTWTYSQALWQHALAEVGIAGAALCLLRSPSTRRALLAGLAAALALAARPTAIVVAGLLALYLWRERRTDLWRFAAVFGAGALLVRTYNVRAVGRATGGYGGVGMGLPDPEALLGLLVSPSRGLFIYCPLALLALVALWRRTDPPLLRWCALALPAYALVFASSRIWWGGFSYGPRFFTDVMPLLTLSALPAARALWARRAGRLLLVAGAAWGIGVQAIGVYFDDHDWDTFPVSVDRQPERLWAWSDPQILRALRTGWRGTEYAPLLWQLLTDPRPAPLVPLAPADLAGEIASPTATPWRCAAGAWCAVELRISNRSAAAVWPAYSDFGELEVGVGAFWRGRDGAVVPGIGGFIPLRRQLGPGDSAPFRLAIDAPRQPGAYELELRVMQSFGATGQHGNAVLALPVRVE